MTAMTKTQAREYVQRQLDAMSDEDYRRISQECLRIVRGLLSELHNKESLRAVLSYRAQPKWKEVDLTPLDHGMSWVRFDYVELSANAPVPTANHDIIFVPLFGFNRDGYRLGHGAGWYDKFLLQHPEAYTIGVGSELGRVDFTLEGHDVRLNAIVTEEGFNHFS